MGRGGQFTYIPTQCNNWCSRWDCVDANATTGVADVTTVVLEDAGGSKGTLAKHFNAIEVVI